LTLPGVAANAAPEIMIRTTSKIIFFITAFNN
jgi:hypothetical protein